MDADIVREVEFSRSLRGYNTAEVDSFLERMEGMFRRRDLEQENLEKKLQDQVQASREQEDKIRLLAVELEKLQQENGSLQTELAQTRAELAGQKDQAAQLSQALSAARAEAVQAEDRCKVLEKTLEAQPQSKLAEVSSAAKGSLKKLSGSLWALRK